MKIMVRYPRKRYEYEKARFLRKQGLSFNEIRDKIGVSKSTVSLWCRDIKLSSVHTHRLLERAQRMIVYKLGARANHERREKEIRFIREMARKDIHDLSEEAFKMVGVALYWAEGAKTTGTSVSNSDPRIIQFMVRWFQRVLNISPSRIKAYLHIHYQDDDLHIKRYWSQLTGIPLQNFGKSFIKPKGTGHRTNILPNGIIKIRAAGIGSENLRHKILAWSERLHELSNTF